MPVSRDQSNSRHHVDYDVDQNNTMTQKIEQTAWRDSTLFTLTGRVKAEQIAELKRLFQIQVDFRSIIVDLQETRLAGREAKGVRLQNFQFQQPVD
jgi:hypothetical protein